MMTLIIGGLVTWRVAHMFVKEQGPLGVFLRLRAYLAAKQQSIGGMFDMISCVACTSVYVGAFVALWFVADAVTWVTYSLAFSALAIILENLTKQTV
jgi:hypothetical protein